MCKNGLTNANDHICQWIMHLPASVNFRCALILSQCRNLYYGILSTGAVSQTAVRYTRNKKENRICKFCDLKEVEAEFHFFFRCKNNHTLRNTLYKDINGICPKFNEYDRAKAQELG